MIGHCILTAAEMRAAEQVVFDGGMGVEALMERAGRAVAETAWRISAGASVLVLCGPGNNGGDGYVIARLLAEWGLPVRVAATGEPRTEAAQIARSKWTGPIETLGDAAPASLLIDALFGTGLMRPLADEMLAPFLSLSLAAKMRLAVDLPSGIATDDGAILSDIPAQHITVALGALKPSHRLQPAVGMMGRIVIADIGVPAQSQLVDITRPNLPMPGPQDHKYTRGHVVVAAGAMSGAARLSALAAARSGAGYVTLAGGAPAGLAAIVHRQVGSAEALAKLLDDRRIGSLVIGPGLGRDRTARERLDVALASAHRLVLDADALMLLADGGLGRLKRQVAWPLLTPHEGEFHTLFGHLEGSKLDRARAAAAKAGAVVLLKGADSVIAAPDGRAAIARAASPWLATAGTGDVLAGIAGTMMARGLDAFAAGKAALWLHGDAARRAGPGLVADDLCDHLPAAMSAAL